MGSHQTRWTVYLPFHFDKNGKPHCSRVIDEVCYSTSCDAEYVRKSLIDHDGYPSNIVVVKSSNVQQR